MSELIGGDRRARIAVEGCGHGTLHAIYASVGESCKAKGWETVDLLIIGGDFQAVRNVYDLNVTAMPQKYRRMADFHEYYSGAQVAPYLTIFIGGNHEASNHLFELYYGGWVAPNIYYMGAANVLRLGPLRIAGLSGIWKGYDYRKQHFERLPYSDAECHSIFHVRELDVRKLLCMRSQVDIGLSHDWPKGVEWCGQHRWLFDKKKGFEADAVSGKLGSVAAALCLNRLRPAYWFSAHLHVKYPALIEHEQAGENRVKPSKVSGRDQGGSEDSRNTASRFLNGGDKDSSLPNIPRQNATASPQLNSRLVPAQDRQQVSAWQNFYVGVQQDDAEERARALKEQQERQEEVARTGIRSRPQYTFTETFKQIETNAGLGRSITAVTTSSPKLGQSKEISNLDGCGASSLKRRRGTSSPDVTEQQPDQHDTANSEHLKATASNTFNRTGASSTAVASAAEYNPDAVEIDLDDTDSEAGDGTVQEALRPSSTATGRLISGPSKGSQLLPGAPASTTASSHDFQTPTSIFSEDGEDGGVRLNPLAQSFQPSPTISRFMERKKSEDLNPLAQSFTSTSSVPEQRRSDEMNPSAQLFALKGSVAPLANSRNDHVSVPEMIGAESQDKSVSDNEPKSMSDDADDYQDDVGGAPVIDNEISEEMRAQLAAFSGSFAPQVTTKSETLPFPEAITNTTTEFLALDKCERDREFLQLLEVEAISDSPLHKSPSRPFRLQYDPEWLAILRVFAPDLELGGNPTKTIKADRGDSYYRDRIAEEAQWVDQHIVKKDLLEVPENFTTTAPIYDPGLRVDSSEMPREYTNPQTSEFCKLLGIENQFDISEEERDARMARGSRPDADHKDFRGGRHESRSRGGGRFNSNRGGGRGGGRGGRGSGRGRGRGRW